MNFWTMWCPPFGEGIPMTIEIEGVLDDLLEWREDFIGRPIHAATFRFYVDTYTLHREVESRLNYVIQDQSVMGYSRKSIITFS